MKESTIVKIRRNSHNQDTCMGVPQAFKEEISKTNFFECSIQGGTLIYTPLNMSGSAEVVQTSAPPQQANAQTVAADV